MTPYEIEIMLHYHTTPNDHPDMGRNPPVWKPTIDGLMEKGLLLRTDRQGRSCYLATERGQVYVMALCDYPLPERAWKLPAVPEQSVDASSSKRDMGTLEVVDLSSRPGEHIAIAAERLVVRG